MFNVRIHERKHRKVGNDMEKENTEILEENNKENKVENQQCHCDKNHSCKHENRHEKKECKYQDDKKEKEYQETIKKLEEENKNLLEKVKLAQADLVNYRRRKDDEVATTLKYANKDLILELLSVVDNFERAIRLDDNDLTDELSKFLAGFKIMYATLMDILKKFGVEEINRVGEIFDPSLEQALLTDKVEDKQDEEVLEVLLKGYKLKDRVIRPASVKINQL